MSSAPSCKAVRISNCSAARLRLAVRKLAAGARPVFYSAAVQVQEIYHQAGRARAYLSRHRRTHPQLFWTGAALVGGIVLIGAVTAYRSHERHVQYEVLLTALWSSYKQHHWDATSGRSMDNQDHDVTTSEGQGYTMLRAVWMNDRGTFDQTWQWTANNIRRPDGLFSWRWGRRPDGSWGILTQQGGENSASDADTDIALALLMASAKWQNAGYKQEALRTITALWNEEVVLANGKLYVGADNLEKHSAQTSFVVNPSYISPAAYHVFAKVDTSHDWDDLVRQSYVFLQAVNNAPLDVRTSSGLTPDWVRVDRATGRLIPPVDQGQTTDYGFNALRTPWRIGLDWQWYHDAAARQTLSDYSLLMRSWQQSHKLYAVYTHDGKPAADYESLALYGGALGYFSVENGSTAAQIVQDKLAAQFNTHTQTFTPPLSYYDNNWVWLGVAMAAGNLPNLADTGGGA